MKIEQSKSKDTRTKRNITHPATDPTAPVRAPAKNFIYQGASEENTHTKIENTNLLKIKTIISGAYLAHQLRWHPELVHMHLI